MWLQPEIFSVGVLQPTDDGKSIAKRRHYHRERADQGKISISSRLRAASALQSRRKSVPLSGHPEPGCMSCTMPYGSWVGDR